MDMVNLILVFLTVVLTAIILYLTYKAQRDSEEGVRLQRRQAALLPDLKFAVIEFGRDPHNPAVGFILFENANVGSTMVTQAHARVLFDGKQLEPVSAAPPTVRESRVEYEQFYNDLKKLGVLSVEMGGDLIEVNMLAPEIPLHSGASLPLGLRRRGLRRSGEGQRGDNACGVLDLAPRLATLKMLMAFSDVLPGRQNSCLYEAHTTYLHGQAAGIKRNQRSVNPGDDLPDVESPKIGYDLDKITTDLAEGWGPFTDLLGVLEQDVLKGVRGMWEAFSGFSRGELGIEPEKLMKAWLEPMWPEIETLASVSDYPVVNKKRVEEYALVLWRHWRKLTT